MDPNGDFEIPLYETPEYELVDLYSRRPHWVERLYLSGGDALADPAASAAIEPLARRLASLALVLRKAGARGWTAELRASNVRILTGLVPDSARRAMVDDGIWQIVQRLVGRRGAALFV